MHPHFWSVDSRLVLSVLFFCFLNYFASFLNVRALFIFGRSRGDGMSNWSSNGLGGNKLNRSNFIVLHAIEILTPFNFCYL